MASGSGRKRTLLELLVDLAEERMGERVGAWTLELSDAGAASRVPWARVLAPAGTAIGYMYRDPYDTYLHGS